MWVCWKAYQSTKTKTASTQNASKKAQCSQSGPGKGEGSQTASQLKQGSSGAGNQPDSLHGPPTPVLQKQLGGEREQQT